MSKLEAGMARKEITAYEPEMQLWGWFMPYNRAEGVATPLYARALVLRDGENALAYVCADLGFISVAVRKIVTHILRTQHPSLGLGEHNVMITATHTHSGPTGYSDVIGQNSVNFGFSPTVLVRVVEGIVESILSAAATCRPAELRLSEVEIPYAERVAFNRSILAYNRNPDVEPVDPAHPAKATRRTTTVLRVDDSRGEPIGCLNWFAVHCTSVHAENTLLHSDNKGVAAMLMEEEQARRGAGGFVAIFAQEAAGDVSPNFRYHAKRNKVIGVYEDDDASARYNAAIQARYAHQGWEKAGATDAMEINALGGIVRHVDMSDVRLPAALCDGVSSQTTTPATWGMLMPAGTAEGPGPMRPLLPMLRRWMKLRRKLTLQSGGKRDTKFPFLELGLGIQGRFLGYIPTYRGLGVVGLVDPTIGYVHALYGASLLGDEPWLPQVVPLQLLQIGDLMIAGLTAEATTVAGKRLRSAIEGGSGQRGLRVVINSYANGYNGYVATPEEYEQQEYEGSYTTFGKWTLPAYCAQFSSLAAVGVETEPTAPVEAPVPPTNTYDTLIQRRKIGRKGAWGRNTETDVPAPHSSYLPLIQKALAMPPHHFKPQELKR